jgi:hypothetical protein
MTGLSDYGLRPKPTYAAAPMTGLSDYGLRPDPTYAYAAHTQRCRSG